MFKKKKKRKTSDFQLLNLQVHLWNSPVNIDQAVMLLEQIPGKQFL